MISRQRVTIAALTTIPLDNGLRPGHSGGRKRENIGASVTELEERVGKFEIDLLHFDGPAPCRDLPHNTGGLWEPFGAIKGEVKAA